MVKDYVKQFLTEKGIITEMTSAGISSYVPEHALSVNAFSKTEEQDPFDELLLKRFSKQSS